MNARVSRRALVGSALPLRFSRAAASAQSGHKLRRILAEEMARSKPGYVVYAPKSLDGSTFDTGKEYFLVFDGPDGSLMAVWTQSSYEGAGDHRIVFSRSDHANNNGRVDGCAPEDTRRNRRPATLALGEFRPNAEQPLWFSESKVLLDNDGRPIGPLKRIDIGVYPSVTNREGSYVLWRPERKFFLLGKRITEEFLADWRVPA